MCFEWFRSRVVFLEFNFNLFNHNMLNVRIMKLQGYMKVIFEASPTRLSYAEFTSVSPLPLLVL